MYKAPVSFTGFSSWARSATTEKLWAGKTFHPGVLLILHARCHHMPGNVTWNSHSVLKSRIFSCSFKKNSCLSARSVFRSGIVWFFTVNCQFRKGFAFVSITFSSPDCQKGMEIFVSINNCGGQQLNLLNITTDHFLCARIDLSRDLYTCIFDLVSCIFHEAEGNRHRFVLVSFAFICFTWECDAQMNWRRLR